MPQRSLAEEVRTEGETSEVLSVQRIPCSSFRRERGGHLVHWKAIAHVVAIVSVALNSGSEDAPISQSGRGKAQLE